MRFCKECNNILHPREQRSTKKLFYACNRCAYKEEADEPDAIVYKNALVKSTNTSLDIVQPEVVDDPTLQRSTNEECERCNYQDAVFFQADEGIGRSSLSLIFVCINCKHKWVR